MAAVLRRVDAVSTASRPQCLGRGRREKGRMELWARTVEEERTEENRLGATEGPPAATLFLYCTRSHKM